MKRWKKIWKFLKEDSWQSWLVSLVLLILFIKFIFFPAMSFITSSPLPLVIVESCSMYHDSNFESWWDKNGQWYETKSISREEFEKFILPEGMNKGDIIFVWGRSEPKIGDIIVFKPNEGSTALHPIIHRVVTLNPLGTKGDNGKTNPDQIKEGRNQQGLDETDISEERYIGKAIARIPVVGWIKLIFFEFQRPESQRGFCF